MMAFRSRVRNPAITTTDSYEETLAVAQQLDLVGPISSNRIGQVKQGNTSGGAQRWLLRSWLCS